MSRNKFKYGAILSLGFKVEEQPDKAHEYNHGYPCQWVSMHLTKRIYLDYDQHTQEVDAIRSNKEGDIQARIKNISRQELGFLLQLHNPGLDLSILKNESDCMFDYQPKANQ